MNDMEIIDINPQGNMSSGSMIRELVSAEIDQQISTAHAYPRSITKVNRNINSLVTLDQEFAKECTFALPRGGKPVTGPSIRMAEVVFSQWGNCRGGARVVHVDRKEMFIEAEGIFHDLETNAATTKRVRRRISDRNGKILSDDMIIVTGNAACSIAFRNAVLAGVPKMVWGPSYDTALRMIKGDVKTLPERRTAAMTAMAAFGLKPDQVYALVGAGGEADIGLDQLVVIGGFHNALKNEELTVEELLAGAAQPAQARVSGSISQRAAATGSAQDKAPASNAGADKALADEAKRVADKRSADEAKVKTDADAAKATAKAQEALAEAKAKADKEEADALVKYREEQQAMIDKANAAEEAETEDADPSGDIGTDAASLTKYFDNILADLLDGADVDEVVAANKDKIAAMEANNPDLHAQLMDEIDAAKD